MIKNFNSCIGEGEFPSELKHTDIAPFHKGRQEQKKVIIDD